MALLKRRLADGPAAEPAAEPPAFGTLKAALRGGDAAERRNAALDLAEHAAAVPALSAALPLEVEPAVQEAIITALIRIGTEEAAASLAALLGSEDAPLRNAGIEALQQMGGAAAGQMERLLSAAEPDVRVFAVNVLERLSDPRVSGWLRRVLAEEPEVNVGLVAVEALVQLGGPEDVPALRGFAARFPDEPFAGFAVDLACRRLAASGSA